MTEHLQQMERCTLGSVLLMPEVLDDIGRIVGPADFTDRSCQHVYGVMLSLQASRRPIDPQLILAESDGIFDAAVFLAELAVAVPSAANAKHYALEVKRASMKRRLEGLGHSLAHSAKNGQPVETILASLRVDIDDLARAATPDYRLVPVSQIDAQETTWLWTSWLAEGTLSVLDGDPGLGKSQITIDIAARLTTGRPFPPQDTDCGTYNTPRDVVLLSAEDDLSRTIKPRCEAAGADLSKVHVLTGTDGGKRPIEIPGDVETIAEIVSRLDAKLVIIDPLMAYLSSSVDSYRDSHMRRALHHLARMAEDTRAAVLLVRHFTKDTTRGAKHRGGGSIGIIGAARTGMLVGPDPDDDSCNVLAMSKNNLAPHPASLRYEIRPATIGAGIGTSRVAWLGETAATADEVASPGGRGEKKESKVELACRMLRELLADGPRPAEEVHRIIEASGISRRTVMEARKNEKIDATKDDFQGPWLLRLPA